MDKWAGKTAVVTGASAGIGAAIAVCLANAGVRVVGLARRPQLIDELKSQVQGSGSIHSRQCDISNLEEVSAAFKWVEESFGAVHVLVNNAGKFAPGNITDLADAPISDDQLLSVLDINVKGLIMCTRHAVASMKKHSFDGHIININSIAGHYIPLLPLFNVYPATKHAVTAFTNTLLNELANIGSGIRVTSISPGLVNTEMAGHVQDMPFLQPTDVADTVLYALSAPPSVNYPYSRLSGIYSKAFDSILFPYR